MSATLRSGTIMENSNSTNVPVSKPRTASSADEAWDAAFAETSGLSEDVTRSDHAIKKGSTLLPEEKNEAKNISRSGHEQEEGPCGKEESSFHLDSEQPYIQPGVVAVRGINHHHNSMASSKSSHQDSLDGMDMLTAELVEEAAIRDEIERGRILEEAKQKVREELKSSAAQVHAVAVLIETETAPVYEAVPKQQRWQCCGIAAVLFLLVAVVGVMYRSELRDKLNPNQKLRASATRGTCGEGSFGNGICSNVVECCSEFGFCGNGTEYCGIVNDNACGGGHRGNGVCANERHCCSEYGFCGTTSEHCSNVTDTCGGGTRGNGICSNGKCCSPHGYCGTTSVFCSSNISETCGGGYRGNGICPDEQQCCTELGLCGFCD